MERRLDLWSAGDFQDLMDEGRALQHQLQLSARKKRGRNTTHSEDQENDQLAQTFARLMFQAK